MVREFWDQKQCAGLAFLEKAKNRFFSEKEAHFLAILGQPFQCIMGRKWPGWSLEAILKILVSVHFFLNTLQIY